MTTSSKYGITFSRGKSNQSARRDDYKIHGDELYIRIEIQKDKNLYDKKSSYQL